MTHTLGNKRNAAQLSATAPESSRPFKRQRVEPASTVNMTFGKNSPGIFVGDMIVDGDRVIMKEAKEKVPRPSLAPFLMRPGGGGVVNMTFGDNSPAVVFGNFFAGGLKQKAKPATIKKIVAPVTVEEVVDVNSGPKQQETSLPTVSDVD